MQPVWKNRGLSAAVLLLLWLSKSATGLHSRGCPPKSLLTLPRLAKLLAQAIQYPLLAAHSEKRTFVVGTLIQHLTAGEYFPTQLLCRPGQEKLGLDKILHRSC